MLSDMTDGQAGRSAPDPKALRALAHPLRWQLIDLVGSEATVTATRCAEVLGESVANCSYHLGILGKYGYLRAGPPARSRQGESQMTAGLITREQEAWTRSRPTLDTEGTPWQPGLQPKAFLRHELSTGQAAWLRSLRPGARPWRAASLLVLSNTTWMTAEDLRDITDQMKRLMLTHE